MASSLKFFVVAILAINSQIEPSFAQCVYPMTQYSISWKEGATTMSQNLSLPAAKQGTYYALFVQPPGQGPCPASPCGHTNCKGHDYEHVHWPAGMFDLTTTINLVEYTITPDKVQAYWELDVYKVADGFTREGPPSFSQNCYGYAFEVGTFAQDGMYGGERLLNPGAPPNGCYQVATAVDKFKVAYRFGHAIKITGKLCAGGSGMQIPIVKTSAEKNRESPIFKRAGDCPGGISLLPNTFAYTFYEKN